jgi:hypothetical protein
LIDGDSKKHFEEKLMKYGGNYMPDFGYPE